MDRAVIRKTTHNASRRKAKSIERDFSLTHLLYHHKETRPFVCEPLKLEKDSVGHSISFIMADWHAQSLRKVLSTDEGVALLANIDNFLNFALNMCSALDRIHRTCNVIHLDVKPENILLLRGHESSDIRRNDSDATPDGLQSDLPSPAFSHSSLNDNSFQVKLIDFGISAVVSTKKPFIHLQNSTGSYQYMPPCQTGRTKAAASFSSDIYSLGIVFYEILNGGKTPFHNVTSPLQLIHAHMSKDPPALKDIPPNLWHVINKMIQKDKSRYQTAFGVLKDLQLLKDGALHDPDFVCGNADELPIFRFPDWLYGRSGDIGSIENLVFNACSKKRPQLITVTGTSGIGKSSLCARALSSALSKHCTGESLYVSSKFDQFQRGSVPYSVIVHVITKLVDIALDTMDQQSLDTLRESVLNKHGAFTNVLTEFIPETRRLLGEEQLKGTSLEDKNERKERFLEVVSSFIGAFGQNRILCIFLDDIQWIDTHSLQVFRKLMTIPDSSIVLFAAYRSNEVDESHILSMTLNDFKKQHIQFETLHLNPLVLDDLNAFVADTLHLAPEECLKLSQMIHEKTDGNPFFARELLSVLHEQGVVFFDSRNSRWKWSEENLDQLTTFTSNVVELMVHNLNTKPALSQRVLGYLAIIGSQFVLDELKFVLPDSSPDELSNAVFTLQQEGWIVEVMDEGSDVKYKFAHDRFQQSSLQLIDEKERSIIHSRLGQRLLDRAGSFESMDDVQLFQCVDHLNHRFEDVRKGDDEKQQQLLLRLNYRASVTAQKTTAFEAAKNYAQMAQKLLATDLWTKMHTKVYVALSDACFALSEHDEAERVLEMVCESCTDESDKYLAHSVLINLRLGVHKADKAFTTTVEQIFQAENTIAHHYLGDMPCDNDDDILLWLKAKKAKIDEQLASLSEKEDVEGLIRRNGKMEKSLPIFQLQKVLFQSTPMMVIAGKASSLHISCLALSGLQCALDHGISIFSSFFLNWTSFTYAVLFKDFSKSVMFYHCGVRLLRSNEFQSEEIMVASFNCLSFCSVFVGTSELVDSHEREGTLLAFDRCSYSWGAYFVVHSQTFLMLHGYPYAMMLQDSQTHRAFLKKGKALFYLDATECVWALARFLSLEDQKLTFNFHSRTREEYKSVRSIRMIIPMCEMIAKYMTDDTEKLFDTAQEYVLNNKDLTGLPQRYLGDTFLGLVYSLILEKDSEPIQNVDDFINSYSKHVSTLEGFCRANEKYFGSIFHLNKAEFLRTTSLHLPHRSTCNAEIMSHYNQAITLAREYGNDLILALTFEKAGQFAIGKQEYLEDTIAMYFQSAAKLYMALDANRKFNALRRDYPRYVYFAGRRKSSHSIVAPPTEKSQVPQSSTVSSGDGSWLELDLQSMMKLSQTISKEVDIDEVMIKSLDILVENIGAQRGFLFLIDQDSRDLRLCAVANVSEKTITICPKSNSSTDDFPYCQSIVEDVLNRSVKNGNSDNNHALVVDNASQQREYSREANVVKYRIKSMICAPIIYQGDTIGLVYCDHNRIEGCFGAESRMFLFEFLLEQIGISIINSRLYQNLTLTNEAYSRFVPNEFLSLLGAKHVWNIRCGHARAMDMTVCFLDIRNWTRSVESLSPKEAFDLINSIWALITPIVTTTGIIDKVLGDAMMILYPGENACDDAVQCAMEVKRVLREKTNVLIGCGIHFGKVMLGTVGTENRLDTSAISDVVNTASRLESITKKLGVDVIISDSVHRKLSPNIREKLFYEVGQFLLKGKKKSTRLYTFQDEHSHRFTKALRAFQRGDRTESRYMFQGLSHHHPLSAYYVNLCDDFHRLGMTDNAIMLDKDGNAIRRQEDIPLKRLTLPNLDAVQRFAPRTAPSRRVRHRVSWNNEKKIYERVYGENQ